MRSVTAAGRSYGLKPPKSGERASEPVDIRVSGAASVGNVVYSFTGLSNNALVTNAYKYDTITNTWTAIASLTRAQRRENPVAVSDGTRYTYSFLTQQVGE